MYTQQLEHLGFESVEALIRRIEAIAPKEWALIVHDKDKDESGKAVKPHVHVVIHWSGSRHITAIAKDLNDSPQYLETWKGRRNNAYLYLIHGTAGAVDKFQYAISDVRSNFDYDSYVKQEVESFNRRDKVNFTDKLDDLLDRLDRLEISYREVQEQLSGSEYSKAYRKIDVVWKRVQERVADEWSAKMRADGKRVDVIYIYGKAGTGKTTRALEIARNRYKEEEIYLSGSSRDPFQGYGQSGTFQKCLVLDELRPMAFSYSDLLKMLDPYIQGKVAVASRYSDKYVMAETIIITTPYSPYEFYDEMCVQQEIDEFEQFRRRISTCLYFNGTDVEEVDVNDLGKEVEKTSAASKVNVYNQSITDELDKLFH